MHAAFCVIENTFIYVHEQYLNYHFHFFIFSFSKFILLFFFMKCFCSETYRRLFEAHGQRGQNIYTVL